MRIWEALGWEWPIIEHGGQLDKFRVSLTSSGVSLTHPGAIYGWLLLDMVLTARIVTPGQVQGQTGGVNVYLVCYCPVQLIHYIAWALNIRAQMLFLKNFTSIMTCDWRNNLALHIEISKLPPYLCLGKQFSGQVLCGAWEKKEGIICTKMGPHAGSIPQVGIILDIQYFPS